MAPTLRLTGLLAALTVIATTAPAQEPCGAVEVTGTFPAVDSGARFLVPTLDGDTLFLVNETEGATQARTGAIYAFERDPATGAWNEVQRIVPEIDCQHFGHSVVLDGDTAVIGSEPRPWFGGPGRMFVYLRDPGTRQWQLAQTVFRPTAWAFPTAIIGSGDRVAAYDPQVGGSLDEHVEVFRRTSAGTYESEAILEPPAFSIDSRFGGAMTFVDEDTLVVTDTDAFVPLPETDGVVYIYRRSANGDWSVAQTLTSGPTGSTEAWGSEVHWDGQRLFVLALRYSSETWSASTWDVFEPDASGTFVRSGEVTPMPASGTAREFRFQGSDSSGTSWFWETEVPTTEPGRMRPWIAGAGGGDWLPGEAAWTFDGATGFRPYPFAIDGDRVAYVQRAQLPGGLAQRNVYVADLGDACGASGRRFCGPALPNSTGAAAALDAYTEGRAAGEPVSLVARDLPVGANCLFLAGRGIAAPTPLGGAGDLCLGPVIGRFRAVGVADEVGTLARHVSSASLPLGGSAVPALPGETWAFQLWYRDGAESRLTSATYMVFR